MKHFTHSTRTARGFVTLAALAAALAGCGGNYSEPATVFTPEDTTTNMRALWGSSANDVWAGGEVGSAECVINGTGLTGAGYLAHFDGTSWQSTVLRTTDSVHALGGTSAHDVWAAAVGCLERPYILNVQMLHWDGSAWTSAFSADFPVGTSIDSVWAVSATDVWAVGTRGDEQGTQSIEMLHFDGVSWSEVTDPAVTGTKLTSVYGATSDSVFAVGDGGVFRFDGAHWSRLDAAPEYPVTVRGVGNEVYLATSFSLYRWDGGAFAELPAPPADLDGPMWAGGANDIWVLGSAGSAHVCDQPSELYVCGDGVYSYVMHFNGVGWWSSAGTTAPNFNTVWSAGDHTALMASSIIVRVE